MAMFGKAGHVGGPAVSRKMHTVPRTVPVRFLRFLGNPTLFSQATKMAMFGRAGHVGGPAIPLFNEVVMF